jgi:hypothetical protein
MATKGPLGIYYDRWMALDDLIVSAYQTYQHEPDLPRKDTILYLLQSLQAFAWGQFQFFYYGFAPEEPQRSAQDPVLQIWDEFPPEDVLTAILQQVAHDLDLIQRAANQRLTANSSVRQTLANADKLVRRALEPAIKYNVIDPPETVLTYFEKAAEFYSIPYAGAAIIAIPFTATMANNFQDFLAIPHEAGHYVFRRPVGNAKNVLRDYPNSPDIPAEYRQWIKSVFEEMCADVYGCLIGGPVMAVDFASLSLANSQPDFRAGDDLHPNPALRPLIYSQVLASPSVRRLTADDWKDMAELLTQHWNNQLRRRHVNEFVVKQTRTDGLKKTIDSQPRIIADDLKPVLTPGVDASHGPLGDVIKNVVEMMIQSLLAYINRYGPVQDPHDLSGWSGPVEAHTDPAALLPHFEAWVREVWANDALVQDAHPLPADLSHPRSVPWLTDRAEHTSDLWLAWLRLNNNPTNALYLWPPKEHILSGEVRNADKLQPGTWGYILYADGWTTGGPGVDHGQPAV